MIKRIKRWQELKQLEHAIKAQELVLQNPVNGCPSDFREEYAEHNHKQVQKLYSLGATDDQINKAIARGLEGADAVAARMWIL